MPGQAAAEKKEPVKEEPARGKKAEAVQPSCRRSNVSQSPRPICIVFSFSRSKCVKVEAIFSWERWILHTSWNVCLKGLKGIIHQDRLLRRAKSKIKVLGLKYGIYSTRVH